jgi:hypothetical protein
MTTRVVVVAASAGLAGLGARVGRTAPRAEHPNVREARSAPADANRNHALPPSSSDELTERARHLFEAVVADRPELADDFFFPREPFLPLKDVADPAKYWSGLVASYHHDIHVLHGKRRSWEGATFRGFELGSTPKWVKPGDEWNKIGYYRTFNGRLNYEVLGKTRSLDVRTIISWDGRWYVTHLLPVRH